MSERRITIELLLHKQVKECEVVTVSRAKEVLAFKMRPGWRWRIALPDPVTDGDEDRYAEDCKACGVTNPYDLV